MHIGSEHISGAEHSKVIYLDFENKVTRFFKDYLRENALLRRFPSFLLQYKLMRTFHRMLFPFNYIKEGDVCVQVGCAEWMFDFGVSMPLIMSAIAGKRGRVIVVEPDQRNIDALDAYCKKHGVKNISMVKKAAWRKKAVNTFTFYEDRSSTNVVTEVEEAGTWTGRAEYEDRKKRIEEIEMDTLDNMLAELGVQPDFMNITINGAELDVMRGMEGILSKGTKVAWLFGDRWWWREGFQFFWDRAYDVVVSDSGYSYRAPTVEGRVSTYKHSVYDALYDVMYAVALPRAGRVSDPREFPMTLYKRKDFHFIGRREHQ